VNGFFSKNLREVVEDKSGWIFMRGGDSAYIACRPLQPYSWKPIEGGGRRLFSPFLKNGFVVQVAARSEFPDLAAFAKAISALPLELQLDPLPSVRFVSLRGTTMEFTYGSIARLNGRPIDYERWPLFGGPFVESEVDSQIVALKHGSLRRTLDFKTLTITDSR
jgi:hypothetical protein